MILILESYVLLEDVDVRVMYNSHPCLQFPLLPERTQEKGKVTKGVRESPIHDTGGLAV